MLHYGDSTTFGFGLKCDGKGQVTGAINMKKYLLGATAAFVCVAATIVSGTAATLDDVMARLDSLQRDNQNLHRDNQAMRKEIAALRQKEPRSTALQAAGSGNAPSRPLTPVASSAMAADFPVKAGGHLEPPRAFSWSGFYMGVHGGYGWGSSDWTLSIVDSNPRSRGFLGGFQGGANHQFGNWVAGIEADFSLINGDATSTDPTIPSFVVGATATARSQIDWLATFTGRFGYAFDRSLLYLKGGVAGAGFKDDFLITFFPGFAVSSAPQNNTRVGWTAGAGFEYAVFNNWSAKIEYNYLDFGSNDELFSLTANGLTQNFNESIKRKLQLVKVGINYKFGGDSR
jgi:outer membrane immunogenic protein